MDNNYLLWGLGTLCVLMMLIWFVDDLLRERKRDRSYRQGSDVDPLLDGMPPPVAFRSRNDGHDGDLDD
ncbi:hypothetical protein [Chitinimonas lacunae]|uniref:Cbb3-type cytochrome c oxidase subunit 3 n=1 Tax=Chitinimonas lacunae TaxID=1963018 RepID=A0ABV8MUL6_9NEIS